MFRAYRNYPYTIPMRVKFFNIFRYFLRLPKIEEWIAQRVIRGSQFWKKAIPPIYFYSAGSFRTSIRNDVQMEFDLANLVDHAIFFGVPKEPGWEKLFTLAKPDAVVVDIGANIGFLTLALARICHEGFVYAFEPSRNNFMRLTRNIDLNKVENVQVFQVALGDRSESKRMYEPFYFNTGANRILNHSPEQMPSETISVQTLDAVVESLGLNRIDILKVDVEGYELFVLRGAKDTIQYHKPILFIELSDENLKHHGLSSRDIMQYLKELSYTVLDVRTMEPLVISKGSLHTDVLCFPSAN